jgi:hypothetical protein
MPTSTELAAILARLQAVEEKIARIGGLPLEEDDPPSSDPDRRLPAIAVAKRYGVTVRTVDRWVEDPDVSFPPPDVIINNRRYWTLPTLRAWDRTCIGRQVTKKAQAEVA